MPPSNTQCFILIDPKRENYFFKDSVVLKYKVYRSLYSCWKQPEIRLLQIPWTRLVNKRYYSLSDKIKL